MTGIFLKLLNMSITASWIVLAVIILRFLLRKAPEWISCLLWGIVALRLVIPVSLESTVSLIPSAEVIPQDIASSQTPAIQSGIPAVNSAVNPIFTEHVTSGGNELDNILFLASVVWIIGVAVMLLYGAVTYMKLRRQVRACLLYRKNVYLCDDVESPFIFGVFRPRIFIPSGIDEEQLQYVLAHENAHIKRRDHWWKPLGFLLLSVYWFNPLLWLAYILLCRDIERACDEKVIAGMDNAGKKGYLEALVACSVHRRLIMACPVAFGEVGVKARVKGILNYKKPAFWIILASVAACVITAVCFLTNPMPCRHEYHGEITVDATCARMGVETRTCKLCQYSYTEPVELLVHTYDTGTVTAAPTCTESGSRALTCTGCGAVKTEAVERIAHTYDDGKVVTEPTCIRLGSRAFTCTGCGAVKTEELGKTDHTAGAAFYITEPNCTEKGEKSATCTVCQDVYVVEILEMNGVHDLKETVLREATCTASGEGVRTCTRCSHSESCTYQKLAHSYEDGTLIPSSCTRRGQKQTICTGCGDEQWTELPESTEHKWVEVGYNWPDHCAYCGAIKPNSASEEYHDRFYDLIDYKRPSAENPEDGKPVFQISP